MISFRYHIVSIMAVFLALGLGILLGSSVVSAPLDARHVAEAQRYKDERDDAKAKASEVTGENNTLRRRIGDEVAPWAVHQRLAGTPFVFVSDTPQVPKWRSHVESALVAAGAEVRGTIVLSERWQLSAPDDETDLVATMQSIVPTYEPGDDPASSALEMLGERFAEPTGRALIDVLGRDGFLTVQGRGDGDWPPPGAAVVVLSQARTEDVPLTRGSGMFAQSVADVTPTLVVADLPTDTSLVTELRDADGLPDALSTFDAATDDTDPGGIGVVAALLAATEGRGGHYGTGRGLTFVAPAPPPD
jgi:hypothetical protein